MYTVLIDKDACKSLIGLYNIVFAFIDNYRLDTLIASYELYLDFKEHLKYILMYDNDFIQINFD